MYTVKIQLEEKQLPVLSLGYLVISFLSDMYIVCRLIYILVFFCMSHFRVSFQQWNCWIKVSLMGKFKLMEQRDIIRGGAYGDFPKAVVFHFLAEW